MKKILFALSLFVGPCSLASAQPASGLVDVLQYACGISIGDGAVHTVSTAPATSCFYGQTTLTGLAAITINGQTPFSFLTASGTVVGPLGTPGSTNNPFIYTAGVYKLTDASVPNLDIAWLAIQAAELQGRTKIPAGQYVVGSAMPLPIMIPVAGEGTGLLQGVPSRTEGDGPRLSILIAGSDFGANIPLVSTGDPAGTYANSLGRYNRGGNFSGDFEGIRLSPVVAQQGFPTRSFTWAGWSMDGFAWGARLRLKDVEIDAGKGFKRGMTVVGDHTLWERLHVFGGYEGLYWPQASSALFGDLQSTDLNVEGQGWASLAVANASITLIAEGETYLSAPITIYGEPGSCLPMLSGSSFHHLMTEYVNLAFIAEGNNLPGVGTNGTSYVDSAKCRNVNDTEIAAWFGSFVGDQDTNFATNSNFVRRASIDINQANNFRILDIHPSGGGMMPNFFAPTGNASPAAGSTANSVSFISAVALNFTTPAGIFIGGQVNTLISQAGTVPLVNSNIQGMTGRNIELNDTGFWHGYMQRLINVGTYTTTTVGDCLEQIAYQVTACGWGGGSGQGVWQAVQGAAMQGGLSTAGNYVPVATAGNSVIFRAGYTSYGSGNLLLKANTGIGQVSFTAGTGGTAGTYNWTSTGGACTTTPVGTITVSGGSITAATITNPGADCVSAPTIPVPSGATLTGATITPTWPSAQVVNANSPGSGAVIGSAAGGNGQESIGTRFFNVNLGVPVPQGTQFTSRPGHIKGSSITPTVALGAAAGTGAGISAVTGTDLAGDFTVTVGTAPTTGTLATVTWGGGNFLASSSHCDVVLHPLSTPLGQDWTGGASNMPITVAIAPAAAQVIKVTYICIQ